ncbi:MAG: Hpt domain-containing protein [Alphaproteobacteria bacterium]|nr:Hpt domain-containing protein [Alphaproteobacteria bacterium]
MDLVAQTEDERGSILALFFETAESILDEMRAANDRECDVEWKGAAHRLRGVSANIGTRSLETLCFEAEKQACAVKAVRTALLREIILELSVIKAFLAEKGLFSPDRGC